MTHYEVLGVAEGASPEEVRSAYLRLARANHPDVVAARPAADRSAAERRMRDVNGAWSVLGDARRRAEYDRSRRGAPVVEPPGFAPFDPLADDPDPLDQPDVPYRRTGGRRLPQALTMAPVLAFLASVAVGAFGLVLDVAALLGLAVLLFVLSCLGLVVIALVTLTAATRDEG